MNILGLGIWELAIIALVLLLFFGANRLPELFRSFGTSVRELKRGLNEDIDQSEKNTSKESASTPASSDTPTAETTSTTSSVTNDRGNTNN
jgi:sec-independent protein translocase protein TatA